MQRMTLGYLAASERHKSRDESQRTVGLPRGSCTLADPMGGSLSLRSQLENQRGHHLVFLATRKLSHAWVGFSHAEWNPHNTQRRFTTQGSPCVEITKLSGCSRSRPHRQCEAKRGYEHVGDAVPTLSAPHKYTTT